ncbi:MAG TPA: HepT-like ribonuclease domain-containing protein [Chthoniobacterales bacterium]|nr:HepT-like ribonuclease domain-containing protein [Chthoniobacterales bacterium]
MSSRDPTLTLRQIVEFADEVAVLVATRARENLESNREFRRALERCVELIGEAATRLPEDWRAAHPKIPWRQIIAPRNILIHGYDVVQAEVFWNVATNDVPNLRDAIIALASEGSDQ